jgi:hypothetical protein
MYHRITRHCTSFADPIGSARQQNFGEACRRGFKVHHSPVALVASLLRCSFAITRPCLGKSSISRSTSDPSGSEVLKVS